MHINEVIKKILRKFGVEVHRFSPASSPTAQLVASLQKFDIDLVFDVGANAGQFVTEMRDGGFEGNVLSFEPLTSAYDDLQKVSERDSKWDLYPRCALGDKDGEIEINIAGNSASSSVLPMLDSHLSAAPHTAYVGKESVPLLTLDGVAPTYIEKYQNPFLKIDTQGFEWAVLDGASNILPQIRGVLLELSLIPLYEGQYLWEDVVSRMKQEGFTLWAIQPGFTDPHDGRTLQCDGIFFRLP
ncbi:FkbM family methyltransferase [Mariprofundus sp. KV]|uniref:FkbM family methyltransferase n=1 Tax=Mariprofundus sp. KV TaxID=2608715 RepID=UPI0015A15772|nr:FkbM family methyltransferase [Mariprofundus sp. KV]NWF36775.1 FkbM family methyltransferase [Mariprofundus sp. KV]